MFVRKVMLPLVLGVVLLASGCAAKSSSSGQVATPPSGVAASAGSTAASPAADANGCPTSNTTSFAKTKFLAHTGLAFGAFHRYVYKPYQAGSFSSGTTLQKGLVYGKAGAAVLFVKREVRLAIVDVQANPLLCKSLAAPLSSLSDKIGGVVTKLKGGDASGIQDAQTAVTAIEGAAASGGAPITEDPNAKIG